MRGLTCDGGGGDAVRALCPEIRAEGVDGRVERVKLVELEAEFVGDEVAVRSFGDGVELGATAGDVERAGGDVGGIASGRSLAANDVISLRVRAGERGGREEERGEDEERRGVHVDAWGGVDEKRGKRTWRGRVGERAASRRLSVVSLR